MAQEREEPWKNTGSMGHFLRKKIPGHLQWRCSQTGAQFRKVSLAALVGVGEWG